MSIQLLELIVLTFTFAECLLSARPCCAGTRLFAPHGSLYSLQMRKLHSGTTTSLTSKCPCDGVPALAGRHSWGPATALGISSSASTHRCTQHGDPQARPQGSTPRSRADGALLPREQSCSPSSTFLAASLFQRCCGFHSSA